MPLPHSALQAAVDLLAADGRVRVFSRRVRTVSSRRRARADPGRRDGGLGKAAVIDHHRAVLNALAAKLTKRTRTSTLADEVGGTTLTFDLWPGHPHEQEVRSLLRSTRAQVLPLWEKVDE